MKLLRTMPEVQEQSDNFLREHERCKYSLKTKFQLLKARNTGYNEGNLQTHRAPGGSFQRYT